MQILLDTHILLWYLEDDKRLSTKKSEIIDDPRIQKFFSLASLWEIAIKRSIGKIPAKVPLHDLVPASIVIFPIQLSHLEIVETLPLHHRDPFDRLLIAQAIAEDFWVMTDDPLFQNYPLKFI